MTSTDSVVPDVEQAELPTNYFDLANLLRGKTRDEQEATRDQLGEQIRDVDAAWHTWSQAMDHLGWEHNIDLGRADLVKQLEDALYTIAAADRANENLIHLSDVEHAEGALGTDIRRWLDDAARTLRGALASAREAHRG